MLAFTPVLGADAAPKINPKASAMATLPARLQKLLNPEAPPMLPGSDGGSAFTSPGSSKMPLIAMAVLTAGATFYTLTRTEWGKKQKARLGLGGR